MPLPQEKRLLIDVIDPIRFINTCWPHITLYDKQKELLYSLRDNDETICPAGNQLGKDFIAGLGALWFFYSRHPVRVVTTSVDDTQLSAVLWGEIRNFLNTSVVALTVDQGGFIVVNDKKLKKIVDGKECGISYLLGRVASDDGSGFLGHHATDPKDLRPDLIPKTLFMVDEASAVPNLYYDKALTWAKRVFIIGNCYPCNNFFYKGTNAGDSYSKDGKRCYRKVLRIKATDSPNVKYALTQIRKGIEPTGEILLPGVKSWQEYQKNLETWDEIKQMVSLNAEFYEGAEVKMFPPAWLVTANAIARTLSPQDNKCISIGCDPAEGGDDTVWTGAGKKGLVFQRAYKTPDTDVIPNTTIALMREFGVPAEMVCFDSGGGGKQHVDRLRALGYNVRAVAFGEPATDPLANTQAARGYRPSAEKIDEKEVRYIYKNRRAEMYHIFRLLLEQGYGIPEQFEELLRQLRPIPLRYDGEGRIYLLPKNKRDPKSKEDTLTELLGCSPDEADSAVLATYAMLNPKKVFIARAL